MAMVATGGIPAIQIPNAHCTAPWASGASFTPVLFIFACLKKRPHSSFVPHLFHAVFCCWLALLLLFGATPKEFFHQFAAHQDTQECWQPREGIYFEQPHHHCDFLSFHLLPFAPAQVLLWRPQALPPFYPVWQEALSPAVFSMAVAGQPQRGPPAV